MLDVNTINFQKSGGLVPCIIQDSRTFQVLMLAYMNQEAVFKTIESGQVTFFSRSKNRLWTKGEESGNFLELVSISLDCDQDTLLCRVNPIGPTCHKGTTSCWNEDKMTAYGTLQKLEQRIASRYDSEPEGSYIASLKKSGIEKIAQKVGEEGVEVVIEALGNNRDLLLNESADLLFHLLILLKAKQVNLDEVLEVLESRMK